MKNEEAPDAPWLRVVRVDYGGCMVATDQGSIFARSKEPTAVGDWVHISADNEPNVEHIAERRTQVTRRDPEGRANHRVAREDQERLGVIGVVVHECPALWLPAEDVGGTVREVDALPIDQVGDSMLRARCVSQVGALHHDHVGHVDAAA